MKNLDNLKEIKKIDKADMLGKVMKLSEMVKLGLKTGENAVIPEGYKKVKKVLYTGLGGSGISGDILKNLLCGKCRIPVFVNRNYTIPGWVDASTLVFAASLSGNTEETIAAFKEALSKKAKVVVITSGGKLRTLAEKNNLPVLLVPGGNPPRASLPYLLFPALFVMKKLGFTAIKAPEFIESIDLLEDLAKSYAPEIKLKDNPAKQLAVKLHKKPVLVFGSADNTDAVAVRWKCQLAENSKVFGFASTIPEMNHNEIVGWELLKENLKKYAVLFLRTQDDLPQVKKRFLLTRKIISRKAGWTGEVNAAGKTPLARQLSLIYFADFVSVYLALLHGVDPTPIKAIDYFKANLSKQ